MLSSRAGQTVAAGVTSGFASAATCFVAAWVTHLPWLDLNAQVAGPIILGVWLLSAIVMGRRVPRSIAVRTGLIAGLAGALFLLVPMGSALVEQPAGDLPLPGASGITDQTWFRALGSLVLGAVVGVIGAVVGSRVVSAEDAPARRWLSRFAACLGAATLPLILVGGLVTTTNSGMAFRDWPTSDGANMFLYPLSLLARPDRFLEHSHRLFGSFIGLGTVVLVVFTFLTERSRGVRIGAVALLVAVCVQGYLGGSRVTENSMALRIVHGYFAQLFFAALVGFALATSPAWSRVATLARDPALRRFKRLATMALHACLLQHLLGAMYRHMKYGGSKGTSHLLYTHAAVALAVFVAALLAVIVSAAAAQVAGPMGRSIKRTGSLAGAALTVQFLLGWGAFFAVTGDKGLLVDPRPMTVAITTAHQANGALLLAALVCLWMWSRRAWRSAPDSGPGPD